MTRQTPNKYYSLLTLLSPNNILKITTLAMNFNPCLDLCFPDEDKNPKVSDFVET